MWRRCRTDGWVANTSPNTSMLSHDTDKARPLELDTVRLVESAAERGAPRREWSSTMEHGYTEVQGLRMHYREWGDPAHPDLLLVHGWTGHGGTWETVVPAFEDRYHIIAPDNRGHGETDKPQTGYHLRDFVTDLAELIDNLGLDRPAYVGHSWGGNIGTMMAATHPEAISRAFLEDPVYWKMVNAFVTSLRQRWRATSAPRPRSAPKARRQASRPRRSTPRSTPTTTSRRTR